MNNSKYELLIDELSIYIKRLTSTKKLITSIKDKIEEININLLKISDLICEKKLREEVLNDFRSYILKRELMQKDLNDLIYNSIKPKLYKFIIYPGVGGLEAEYFANELRSLYLKSFDILAKNNSLNQVKIKEKTVVFNNDELFNLFRTEIGTHRIQRIPETEVKGRTHTSTAFVDIVKEYMEFETFTDEDFETSAMRSSGAGGQHVNKTSSAARIVHKASGLNIRVDKHKEHDRNRAEAKQMMLDLLNDKIQEILVKYFPYTKKDMSRSEKIRTYNFLDNRITDHRRSVSFFNLKEIMLSGDKFLEMIVKINSLENNLS